jgi:hypothetical protein
MEVLRKPKQDVHPEVVARAFRVNLRTVFRWIEREHLQLHRSCWFKCS